MHRVRLTKIGSTVLTLGEIVVNSGVVARGGRGGAIVPPAGLKNRGATEHKGRQQLKVCNN